MSSLDASLQGRTEFGGGLASINHPPEWLVEDHGEFMLVFEPDEGACFALAAFEGNRRNARQLLEERKDSRELQPIGPVVEIPSAHWAGVMRHFQGTAPADNFETRRMVLCAEREGVIVSIVLNTSPERWSLRSSLYEQVASTLRIKGLEANAPSNSG